MCLLRLLDLACFDFFPKTHLAILRILLSDAGFREGEGEFLLPINIDFIDTIKWSVVPYQDHLFEYIELVKIGESCRLPCNRQE